VYHIIVHDDLMLLPMASNRPSSILPCALSLQLLVLQLALQLLRLGHLPHRLVEIVLVNGISVVFDGE
jgi:hypothetical protein